LSVLSPPQSFILFPYSTLFRSKTYGTAWRCDFDYLVYSKLFPARKNKKDTRQISRHMGEYHRSSARYGNTVLLVFLYSAVYRIYKRRLTTWSYILLFDFFAEDRKSTRLN